MDKLSVHAESCNIWNNSQLEKTGLCELECKDCASAASLLIVKTLSIWRWDIRIPAYWKFGDWSAVDLFLTRVNVYILQCGICNTKYRVYPSFVLKGTSLTMFALVFISFVYETTDLKWRDIPIVFCHRSEVIAHSTLYKAVHGMAKSLSLHISVIIKGIQELTDIYQSHDVDPQISGSIKTKSILVHTKARELLIIAFLLNIRPYSSDYNDFPSSFYVYIKKAEIVLSNVDPPVSMLYRHKIFV